MGLLAQVRAAIEQRRIQRERKRQLDDRSWTRRVLWHLPHPLIVAIEASVAAMKIGRQEPSRRSVAKRMSRRSKWYRSHVGLIDCEWVPRRRGKGERRSTWRRAEVARRAELTKRILAVPAAYRW